MVLHHHVVRIAWTPARAAKRGAARRRASGEGAAPKGGAQPRREGGRLRPLRAAGSPRARPARRAPRAASPRARPWPCCWPSLAAAKQAGPAGPCAWGLAAWLASRRAALTSRRSRRAFVGGRAGSEALGVTWHSRAGAQWASQTARPAGMLGARSGLSRASRTRGPSWLGGWALHIGRRPCKVARADRLVMRACGTRSTQHSGWAK